MVLASMDASKLPVYKVDNLGQAKPSHRNKTNDAAVPMTRSDRSNDDKESSSEITESYSNHDGDSDYQMSEAGSDRSEFPALLRAEKMKVYQDNKLVEQKKAAAQDEIVKTFQRLKDLQSNSGRNREAEKNGDLGRSPDFKSLVSEGNNYIIKSIAQGKINDQTTKNGDSIKQSFDSIFKRAMAKIMNDSKWRMWIRMRVLFLRFSSPRLIEQP